MPNIRKSADAPCTSCGERKPYSEYYPSKAHANGRESRCKDCCRARAKAYAEDHPQPTEVLTERSRNWRAKNTEKNREYMREWKRKEYQRLRRAAIDRYGPNCACCGETEYAFMCIDHVNGGGGEHRRSMGNRVDIYTWLKRAGYPEEGYQVLCHNCNFAKSVHGLCPHQKPI